MNLLMVYPDRKLLHFLRANPKSWIGASLPKFKATAEEVIAQTSLTKKELRDMPWLQRCDYLHRYALEWQERRWEATVGIRPEASHFTLIVPIYNEANSLPSFLSTL